MKARDVMEEYMRLPLYPVSDGLRSRINAETAKLVK
jgi:hypothetical protein